MATSRSHRRHGPGGRVVGLGWDVFDTILGAADFSGDAAGDVLARKPDGTLWLYAGTGTGSFRAGVRIGLGWQVFEEIVRRATSPATGQADVLARKPDGTLWLYAGNGRGGWAAAGRRIGLGWQVFDRVLSPATSPATVPPTCSPASPTAPSGSTPATAGRLGRRGPADRPGLADLRRHSLRGPHRRRPIRRAGVAHRRHPPRLPRERSRRLGLRRPDDCSGLGQCRAGDRHPLGVLTTGLGTLGDGVIERLTRR